MIHAQYSIKWHGNCLYSPELHTPIIIFFPVKFHPIGILNVTVYILDEFHLRVLLLRRTILWHQFLITLFPQTQQGVLPEICWQYKSRSCAVSIFYYSLYAFPWKRRKIKEARESLTEKWTKYCTLPDEICLRYIHESAAPAPLGIQFIFPPSS